MTNITIPFTRPWDIKIPAVIRYLEKEFIDSFFIDGSLMISSFHKFRKHHDEQRGDMNEGRITMQIEGNKSRGTVISFDGSCSFVLSVSIIQSKELMLQLNPAYNEGIRKNNTVGFAHAIASKIPEFAGGFQGNCIYQDDLVVRRKNASDFSFEPPNNEKEMEKMADSYERYIAQQNNHESFFLKALKYSNQNEYRFVWRTSLTEIRPDIIVKCPEARQYCERVVFL